MADLPTWAEAGKAEYFTDAVTLGLIQARARTLSAPPRCPPCVSLHASLTSLPRAQGIMFNWVEVLRWKDMKNPGSVSEARTLARGYGAAYMGMAGR